MALSHEQGFPVLLGDGALSCRGVALTTGQVRGGDCTDTPGHGCLQATGAEAVATILLLL